MQTEAMARDKTFNMRLAPEEWARFEAVASHYELPVASMIRMLVKEKFDAIKRPPAGLVPSGTREVMLRVGDKLMRATVVEMKGPIVEVPLLKIVSTKKDAPRKKR